MSNPPRGFQEIHIGVDDLPFIDKLLEEKNCTYQMKEGRKLFCSAISLDDLHKGYSLPNRAITSRAICLACDLPGTDYLCSNLSHPAIMSRQGVGLAPRRFAAGALCERGEPGAEQAPAQCRPDGHRCWERIVDRRARLLKFLPRHLLSMRHLATLTPFGALPIEALGVIREKVRNFSLGSAGS